MIQHQFCSMWCGGMITNMIFGIILIWILMLAAGRAALCWGPCLCRFARCWNEQAARWALGGWVAIWRREEEPSQLFLVRLPVVDWLLFLLAKNGQAGFVANHAAIGCALNIQDPELNANGTVVFRSNDALLLGGAVSSHTPASLSWVTKAQLER